MLVSSDFNSMDSIRNAAAGLRDAAENLHKSASTRDKPLAINAEILDGLTKKLGELGKELQRFTSPGVKLTKKEQGLVKETQNFLTEAKVKIQALSHIIKPPGAATVAKTAQTLKAAEGIQKKMLEKAPSEDNLEAMDQVYEHLSTKLSDFKSSAKKHGATPAILENIQNLEIIVRSIDKAIRNCEDPNSAKQSAAIFASRSQNLKETMQSLLKEGAITNEQHVSLMDSLQLMLQDFVDKASDDPDPTVQRHLKKAKDNIDQTARLLVDNPAPRARKRDAARNFIKAHIPESIIQAGKKQANINEEVDDFVAQFLHPYITGEITKENEKANRQPIIKQLFTHLENKGIDLADTEKAKAADAAYESYIKHAILGLYVVTPPPERSVKTNSSDSVKLIKNVRKNETTQGNINSNSEVFKAFVPDLREALRKDFPGKVVADKDLIRGLNEVNSMREKAVDEAFDYDFQADTGRRDRIDKYLEENPPDETKTHFLP